MTQTGIAAELGRSVSELFRMLACLERRGYVARPSFGEGYVLTMRLHELANLYPPTRRLLDVALPAIRALAERTRQSCHLGVYSAGQLYVVAQVESPAPVGFSVRLATGFPLLGTASGRVLLAFQPGEVRRAWLGPAVDEHAPRLDTIQDLGFERIAGETFRGITDLSRPVLDQRGHALAALTVPYAEMSGAHASLDETAGLLAETAAAIGSASAPAAAGPGTKCTGPPGEVAAAAGGGMTGCGGAATGREAEDAAGRNGSGGAGCWRSGRKGSRAAS